MSFYCLLLDADVDTRETQELEMFATDFGLAQRQAVCVQRRLEFLKVKIKGINKVLEEVQSTLDPDRVVLPNTGWA